MSNTETKTVQEQRSRATPEEEELNRLALDRARATQSGQIQAQQQGLNLINQLLVGGELPGFLEGLPGGLSEDVISDISQKAVSDLQPSFQASGILDSGINAELSALTAGDIRRSAAEFNIGNLLNLLNLAVGGQAQIQQPLLSQSQALGQRLAGLRSTTGTQTQTSANPFLRSFQESLGSTLGGGGLSFGITKSL